MNKIQVTEDDVKSSRFSHNDICFVKIENRNILR